MELDKTLNDNHKDFHIPEDRYKLENLYGENGSWLRDKLDELVPLIDKKLGYRVDFYPMEYQGETVLGVAPFDSLLMTALIGWDTYHERYEVKSPRIHREKNVHDMQIFRGYWVNDVLVSKSRSKIVNTVCAFRPYLDQEVYIGNLNRSMHEAKEACGRSAKQLRELDAKWCWRFGSQEAEDLLRVLNHNHITDGPITFDPDGPLMQSFTKHKKEEAELKQKLEYVGDLSPVHLIKQHAHSDQITVMVHRDDRTTILHYPNVQALPQEMQNKLFTLSTVANDGHRVNTNVVDGVGAKAKPLLCEEACWLAVSNDIVEEIINKGNYI